MKILVVTQYFWPESFRVNDLVLGLKERGHEVTVFTGKPNYPNGAFFASYAMFGQSKEVWNSIPVYRSPLIARGNGKSVRLILNYLSFIFFGCLKALFLNLSYDVILAYQQSPVTAALPAIVFKYKSKARMYLYVQDLWPESVVATTQIKNKYFIGLLGKLTAWIYKKSDGIVVQSKAFINYLLERQVEKSKIFYLPNATDNFYRKEAKQSELIKYFQGDMNIVFAGNIGEAQSFKTLVAAAKIVKAKDNRINWVIIGEGRKKAEIVEMIKQEGLDDVFIFLGQFSPEKMPFFFAYADALLVSLKKDFIFSLTIPTKLQSYMACGRPIIGSIDGEGRAIIDEAECGLTSAAEDAESLAKNILIFRKMSEAQKELLAINAIEYYEREFNRNRLLNRLVDILKT